MSLLLPDVLAGKLMQNESVEQCGRNRIDGEWRFAFLLSALFLLCAGFTNFHHEMWRDELQAWLICRDSSSISDIFVHSRYEGHPSLWYFCLWPLTRFTRDPAIMQGLNVTIVAAAVFLIAKYAPAPRWLRALAAFGYFPVYEYGSIARNYGLSLLTVIAICVIFPARRERPVLLGITIFLAANTSLHACVLAIAILVALLVEGIIRPPPSTRRVAIWAGFGIAVIGIILSAVQMYPPADSWLTGWFFGFDALKLGFVLHAMTKAYFPLPKPGPGFWNTDLLALLPKYVFYAWVGTGTATLLGLVSVALVRRPVALAYYLSGSLGLLVFFYTKYLGSLRHQGFLFVCLGTALWLASATQPITLPKMLCKVARRAERAVSLLFISLLLIHVTAAGIAVSGEYTYVFSAAKATANLIRQKGLDRLMMVSANDYTTAPVVAYLESDGAYYSDTGRFGSYTIYDRAGEAINSHVWEDAAWLAQTRKSSVVILVDNADLVKTPIPLELEPALQLVGCLASSIRLDESYCVFLLGRTVGPVRHER
jgi:hypothetical protein